MTFGAAQFTRNGRHLQRKPQCRRLLHHRRQIHRERPEQPPWQTTAYLTLAYTNVSVNGSPVTLTGTSAPMVVTPATLNFGSIGAVQPPGPTSSAAQTLTVRNGSGCARQRDDRGVPRRILACHSGTGRRWKLRCKPEQRRYMHHQRRLHSDGCPALQRKPGDHNHGGLWPIHRLPSPETA